jgi:hypothetical protein
VIDPALAEKKTPHGDAKFKSVTNIGVTGFEPSLVIQSSSFNPTSNSAAGPICPPLGSSQPSSLRSSLCNPGKTREICEPMSETIDAEGHDPLQVLIGS